MLKPLDVDTVRVRWLSAEPTDTQCQSCWRGMLAPEELQQADRFQFASDRDAYTAAHALARTMLSEATGQPTSFWQVVKGEFGKPTLIGSGTARCLRFNISHTRGFVACAIAHEDVGVDVEASDRSTDLDIAARFFAPEEVQLLKSVALEHRARIFFRFWTLKEAFIKATGEGLSRPLNSFSFKLDPVQIVFHPERDDVPRREDPAVWQFAEYEAVSNRPIAVAVRRTNLRPLRLDACGSRPEEIAPR